MQAVTIRDTDNNMQWNEAEGLLTYRARKIYSFVPELSAEGYKDPDKIFVTVKSSEEESQLLPTVSVFQHISQPDRLKYLSQASLLVEPLNLGATTNLCKADFPVGSRSIASIKHVCLNLEYLFFKAFLCLSWPDPRH